MQLRRYAGRPYADVSLAQRAMRPASNGRGESDLWCEQVSNYSNDSARQLVRILPSTSPLDERVRLLNQQGRK